MRNCSETSLNLNASFSSFIKKSPEDNIINFHSSSAMDKINWLFYGTPPILEKKSKFEPGVDIPCFARFKCSICHRVWGSVWAWKKFGQQCKICIDVIHKLAKAPHRTAWEVGDEIKKLPKEPGFDFSDVHYYWCPQCKNYWAWEKIEEGMRCKAKIKELQKICGNLVYPESTKEYWKYEKAWINPKNFPNKIDSYLPHIMGLCEFCKLGGCMRKEFEERNARRLEQEKLREEMEMEEMVRRREEMEEKSRKKAEMEEKRQMEMLRRKAAEMSWRKAVIQKKLRWKEDLEKELRRKAEMEAAKLRQKVEMQRKLQRKEELETELIQMKESLQKSAPAPHNDEPVFIKWKYSSGKKDVEESVPAPHNTEPDLITWESEDSGICSKVEGQQLIEENFEMPNRRLEILGKLRLRHAGCVAS